MLYTQTDYATIKKKKRASVVTLIFLYTLAFAGGLVPMLVGRQLVLSIILCSLLTAATAIVQGTAFAPVFAYNRLLVDAQENIRHNFQGSYVGEGDDALREGVPCHVLFFQREDAEEPHKCYYDATLPAMQLTQGHDYSIMHTGNLILALQPAAQGSF